MPVLGLTLRTNMQANTGLHTTTDVAVPAAVPAKLRRARALRPKRERFAQRFAALGNAAQAYREVFKPGPNMSGHVLRQLAYRTAHEPAVAERVRQILAEAAEGTTISARARMVHLQAIAEADPGELVCVVADCCRRCYGIGHAYQWIDAEEFATAAAAAKRSRRRKALLPSDAGGYGYQRDREPAPDCPACRGEGVQRVVVTPTDQLSPAARKLLAGVRQKATGEIEVRLHDQLTAMDMLNRMQGAYAPERSVAVAAHVNVDFKTMTRDEQLEFLNSLRPVSA